jgi:neutral ceramidase
VILIGTGKEKIIPETKSMRLLGYVQSGHIANGKETDLYVRVVWVKIKQTSYCFIHFELLMVSSFLKNAILDRFKDKAWKRFHINAAHVIVTAQNTHSAPGGYTHHEVYQFASEPFNKSYFELLVNAALEAASKAVSRLQHTKMIYSVSLFDHDQDVAFNRSIEAYNANEDTKELEATETHLAVNRIMRQLKFVSEQGIPLAILNWFGVHGNSVSNKNYKIHSDNKGYAASLMEQHASIGNDFLALFCNEACGDVSPNYNGSATKKWWPRGKFDDDSKSAYFNGFIQFEKAKEMVESSDYDIEISQTIDVYWGIVKMNGLEIKDIYTESKKNEKTGEASLGLSVIGGNDVDGEGIDSFNLSLIKFWINAYNWWRKIPIINSKKTRIKNKIQEKAQGNKKIIFQATDRKLLGIKRIAYIPSFSGYGDDFDEFRMRLKNQEIEHDTWLPQSIELQMWLFGEVLLVAFPGDITTQASNRLRTALLSHFETKGKHLVDVVIQSYSNEYAGYCTTPEEYDQVTFEAGFTLFGKYTLAAFKQEFIKLTSEHKKP